MDRGSLHRVLALMDLVGDALMYLMCQQDWVDCYRNLPGFRERHWLHANGYAAMASPCAADAR
ncbi:hypothetical protein V4890_21000 [Ralstonia solanacearum species complex bacterium KE056]|uniref:hypothetical protein n=1 Tax=Ralstonia solanacearum species complex bacterium KE056 TaxID=3119585 RepID=UPI002FC2E71A